MNNTDSKGDTISQTNKENYQASWIPLLSDYPSQLKWFHCCFSSMDALFLLSSFQHTVHSTRIKVRINYWVESHHFYFSVKSMIYCVYQWQIRLRAAPSQRGGSLGGTAQQHSFFKTPSPSLLLCTALLIEAIIKGSHSLILLKKSSKQISNDLISLVLSYTTTQEYLC